MAGYKAHIAFGMVTGLAVSIAAVSISAVVFWFSPLVFLATVIGAFIPDLDSDTGLPLKILLRVLSIVGAAMVGYYFFQAGADSLLTIVGFPLTAALFIYYVFGGIFKKLTRHRGIFHSIPAAILSILITFSVLQPFHFDPNVLMMISLAVGIGYLSHLVLDELNSTVNLGGIPFIPNKAIGTALKFYSNNMVINGALYTTILVLGYYHWDQIAALIQGFNK